jgi:hypothetical protein
MIRIITQLKTGPLKEFPKELRAACSKEVRITAFEIERQAKLLAPVDTGALRASIYVVTNSINERAESMAEAESLYWKDKTEAERAKGLPVSDGPGQPSDDLTAYVAVGMAYGIHQEYGTARTPAKLYMTQATEMNRKPFQEAIQQAFKEAGIKSGWE